LSSLKCPQCQSAFREVLKEGVLIDVCTQCRGVWLDRGELEKLLTLARDDDNDDYEKRPQPTREMPRYEDKPRIDDRPRYDDRDRGYYKDDDDYKHGKRYKKKSLFDLFDFD